MHTNPSYKLINTHYKKNEHFVIIKQYIYTNWFCATMQYEYKVINTFRINTNLLL